MGRLRIILSLVIVVAWTNICGAQAKTSTGFIWPIGTSAYSSKAGTWMGRSKPNGGYTDGFYHVGVDMMDPIGSPAYAIADGTIIYANYDGWGSTNNKSNACLAISHTTSDGQQFTAFYGHIQPAKTSGTVKAGDILGTVGDWSYGPHLHFGVRPGVGYPTSHWGMMPNASYASTNGFISPVDWITTHSPKGYDPWPWKSLPGSTSKPIATSDVDGLLYFLHRGNDAKIYYTWMDGNESVNTWHQLPGQTDFPLGMTVLNGARYMAHLGQDGRLYYGYLSGISDHTSFKGWWQSGETSSQAPSIVQANGYLYMIHRGSGGDSGIYLDQYSAQFGWIGNYKIPGSVSGRPTISNFAGEVWGAHTGNDGYIYVANLSRTLTWTRMGGTSTTAPSMYEYNHRLYLAQRGLDTNHVYVWSTNGGGNWVLEQDLSESTNIQPGLFTFYGKLYVTRVDPAGTMWFKRLL